MKPLTIQYQQSNPRDIQAAGQGPDTLSAVFQAVEKKGTRQGATVICEPLNPTEKRLLRELLAGKRNREIAAACHLKEQTAKNYIARIYIKLGISHDRQIIPRIEEIRLLITES